MSRHASWILPLVVCQCLAVPAWADKHVQGSIPAQADALQGSAPTKGTPPLPIKVVSAPKPVRVQLPGSDAASRLLLTVDQACAIALENSLSLKTAQAKVRQVQGAYQSVKAGQEPSLLLKTGYTAVGRISGASTHGSGDFALVLEQLLWDQGRLQAAIECQRRLLEAAERDARASEQELLFQVRSEYYHLAAKRRLADVARADLDNRRSNLRLAKAKWECGSGLPADVVRAESLVASATVSCNAARAEWVSQAARFSNLLELGPLVTVEPADAFSLPSLEESPLEELIAEAKSHRQEVQACQLRVLAAECACQAAEREGGPELSASAEVGGGGNSYPPVSWAYQGGLELSWRLADGGQRKGLIAQAAALKEQAELAAQDLGKTIETEVVVCWVALNTALGSLEAADAAETNAREYVRIAEGRYEAGLGTFLEVIDAQNSLNSSSMQLVGAVEATWIARASFDRALGREMRSEKNTEGPSMP